MSEQTQKGNQNTSKTLSDFSILIQGENMYRKGFDSTGKKSKKPGEG